MPSGWAIASLSLLLLVQTGCEDPCTLETCPELCGDGYAEEWEACDVGYDTETCDSDCTLPVCGDGYLNGYAGEECDDGGSENDGWCDSRCQRQTDPAWCEEVGQYGSCEENVLYFCQDDDYYDLICSLEYQDGTCGLVNESWGYDCIAPLGHPCLLSASESSVRFAPCAGEESGCGLAAGVSGCIANFGTCDSGSPPECQEDGVLTLCSPFGQVARVQCASYGATCMPQARSCVGAGQGQPCIEGLVYCSEELDCIQNQCAVTDLP